MIYLYNFISVNKIHGYNHDHQHYQQNDIIFYYIHSPESSEKEARMRQTEPMCNLVYVWEGNLVKQNKLC